MRPTTRLLAPLLLLCLSIPAYSQAASRTVSASICSTGPAVSIADPADGTQTESTMIVVSGQATPGYDLTVYDNASPVAETSVGADGNFSIGVPLEVGSNALHAHLSLSGCAATVDSATVSVTRLPPPTPATSPASPRPGTGATPVSSAPGTTSPPAAPAPPVSAVTPITITSDAKNGASTVSKQIIIAGTAYPGARVSFFLNGASLGWVTAADDGRFLLRVSLVYGDNLIRISAPPLNDVVITIRRLHDYRLEEWGAAAAAALTLAFFGGHVLIHHRRNPQHPAYVKLGWRHPPSH